MYLTARQASGAAPGMIHVSSDLADIYREDNRRTATGQGPRLLVLEGGLGGGETAAAFRSPRWPLDLLATLKLPAGHHWLIAEDRENARPMAPPDVQSVAQAAGLHGVPRGNVRCTWSIRRYYERQSTDGDLAWWSCLMALNAETTGMARGILAGLHGLMLAAQRAGGRIFVEQLTIVLTKDARNPDMALTPMVHADEYYGRRETAIASLLEEGWSRKGGTLFLPTCSMQELADRAPIRLDRVDRELAHLPIVMSGSGEVTIYDGMIGPDGKVDRRLGVPHISADEPGHSARLVVLMHHRPPSADELAQA